MTGYAYDMNNDIYVLDYGISAELNDDTYDNGIYQNDKYINNRFAGDVRKKLDGVRTKLNFENLGFNKEQFGDGAANGGLQIFNYDYESEYQNTAFNSYVNKKYTADNKSVQGNTSVLYTPTKFMDSIDQFVYGVSVSADDGMGALTAEMYAKVSVMPADVVYYEDNFAQSGSADANGTNGIIYNGATEVTDGEKVTTQTNGLNMQYGFDPTYANGTDKFSNGSAQSLGDGATASFEFTSTGFDIVSRTTTTTGIIIVNVYQKVKDGKTVSVGSDGIVSIDDANMKPYNNLVKTIVVNTYYENGDLYQIPVVSWKNETKDTYVVSIISYNGGNPLKTVYIDGIRIYNPAQGVTIDGITTDDEYNKIAEKDAEIKEIKQMIFGKGYVFDYLDPENSTPGTNPCATMIQFNENGAYYLSGKTVVEAYTGDADGEIGQETNPNLTKDLMTYAVNGPNNELYLSSGYGFGFAIEQGSGTDGKLLQIGVKKVQGATLKLQYLNKDKEWKMLPEEADTGIGSATEVYYRLDNINDLYIDADGRQNVVLKVAGENTGMESFLSLTNVKVKNYTLTALSVKDMTSSAKEEKAALNPTNFNYIAGYNASMRFFYANRYATVTFETSTDVEEIKVANVGDIVNGAVDADKEVKLVTVSYKDNGNIRQWRIKFKLAEKTNTLHMVAYDLEGNYSQTVAFGKDGR